MSNRALVATMLAAVLLLAGGCGGDDSDGGGSGEAPEGGAMADAAAQDFTPVVASTLGAETAPVRGTDGRYHVVYELHLTNAKLAPATIERVEVLDESDPEVVLGELGGEELVENLRTLSVTPVEDATIEPQGSRFLFVELAFDSADEAPDQVIHRFEMKAAADPGATEPSEVAYTATPFTIGEREPVTISPPVEGENWIAVNGCCSPGFVHRDAVQSVNGELWDSQRFAIDFMQMSDDGRVVRGKVSNPESWTHYGADVHSVADGTVVSIANDLPDQVPGALPDPSSFDSLESVDGNYVVMDLGNGVYAFYAHLQKGSVQVEPGDEVAAGEKIGLLGNSGNTSAPHMHLHLMTGPGALAADGIPYVFDSFEYAGEVPPIDFLESERLTEDFGGDRLAEPESREDELPLNLSILNFP